MCILSEYPNSCMCSLGGPKVCRDGLVPLQWNELWWILGSTGGYCQAPASCSNGSCMCSCIQTLTRVSINTKGR